jgi:hypothetical protein
VSRGANLLQSCERGKQLYLLLYAEARAIISHPEADRRGLACGRVDQALRAQFYIRWLPTVLDGVADIVDSHLFDSRRVTQPQQRDIAVDHI